MSGNKTDYLRDALLNHVLRNTSYTSPTTLYLGIFIGEVELSEGGYIRQEITFDAPNEGVCVNSDVILFPEATDDWGTVDGGKIFDQETLGNALYSADLGSPKPIGENDQLRFKAGEVTVQEQ